MKTLEYYFEHFEHQIIYYNKYWEDPLGETQLRTNTEESVDLLESYFNLLLVKRKQLKKKMINMEDYNAYPDDVKIILKNIIDIVNDGRDLWTQTESYNYEGSDGKKPRIHKRCDDNGRLSFENDPWNSLEGYIKDCQTMKEIIASQKATVNFQCFCENGQWYYFEGYESGSVAVKFRRINKNKDGEFTFDGDMVEFPTVNTRHDGDGILWCDDCENIKFSRLPYAPDEYDEDDYEDVMFDFINNVEHGDTEYIYKQLDGMTNYIKECIADRERWRKQRLAKNN